MSMRVWRAGLSGFAMALVPLGAAVAHEIVGNRFFPATLGIDDPGVNDELSLPTVANFKTGDDHVQAARFFRRIFQAHHRSICDFVWINLQQFRGSRRTDRVGSARISESGNDLQISPLQGPGT